MLCTEKMEDYTAHTIKTFHDSQKIMGKKVISEEEKGILIRNKIIQILHIFRVKYFYENIISFFIVNFLLSFTK